MKAVGKITLLLRDAYKTQHQSTKMIVNFIKVNL